LLNPFFKDTRCVSEYHGMINPTIALGILISTYGRFIELGGNQAMLSGDGHQIDSSLPKENWVQRFWVLLTGDATLSGTVQDSSQRALHATTHKLVQVQQQINRVQAQHNLEMARLAQAYHELSGTNRATLPQNLQQQLNRIESEYF
jgi:hypothetical protein